MTTEIIKGVIAIVIIAGAIISIFLSNSIAQDFLIPLAGFAFGYYFNQAEKPITMRLKTAFSNKKTDTEN